MRCLVVDVPVIHKGFLSLLKEEDGCDVIYVIGKELLAKFTDPTADIHRLSVWEARRYIEDVLGKKTGILYLSNLAEVSVCELVMVDDYVSRSIADTYFLGKDIEWRKIFLRHDRNSVRKSKGVQHDRVSHDEHDRAMLALALAQADKSSDWWRQVGGVIVKDGKDILADYNRHFPTEYSQYIEGDPRDFVQAGTQPEMCTAIHAEQILIAQAARHGIALEGTDIYLTVFPCPICAKMIAQSGMRKVFFSEGSSYLDSERILKQAKVEIILVKQ